MKLSSIDENRAFILEITLVKKVNHHSSLTVELDLYDWDYWSDLQKMLLTQVTLEDDTTLLACGVVTEVVADFLPDKRIVTIHVRSLSCEFDKTKENRVFQSQNQGWKDIFSYLTEKSKPDLNVEIDKDVPDSVFEEAQKQGILLQQEETDFQFLVKVAEKLGVFLFVKDTNKKSCGLLLGTSLSQSNKSFELEDFLSISQSMTEHETIIKAKSEVCLELGDTLKISGFPYIITEMKSHYYQQVTTYEYVLYRRLTQVNSLYVETAVAHVGVCKVLSNEDPERLGRLQVACMDMEDTKPKEAVWLSYLPQLTEKDKGVICMPDPEELVYVILRGTVGYVTGCVRKDSIQEEIDVTEHRTVYVRDVKWMVTKEKGEVSYNDTKTEWSPEQINATTKEIHMKAEETFAIESKTISEKAEDSLSLQGKTISEKAEDTLSLQGKTFSEKADNTLSIDCKTLDIKGSSAVNADTPKFNIK